MAETLAQFSKILKGVGGRPDTLVAVKIHLQAVSLVELRFAGDRIDVITLHSVSLPRLVDFKNIQRSQDMIADAIRSIKDEINLTAVDAAISLPGGIVQVRIVNLPYMSPKELAKEARDVEFWIETEPDLGKYENPYINYQVLVSSENDDLTRVLVCYAEESMIQPWIDIVLASHLNPVFVESDSLSLVNLRHATLPVDEQRQGQVIVQLSYNTCQVIAFERDKIHQLKLEISEFDLVLLDQAEEAGKLDGEFWDEVGGRVTNVIKQSLLYLQEEQDFQPFSMVYLVSEYSRCKNITPLLDKHLDLAPLTRWNPLQTLSFTNDVSKFAVTYENPSLLASAIGVSMQRLNIYGDRKRTIMDVNMLPNEKTLKRNRQYSVISTTLARAFVASVLVLGVWTGGMVIPQFIESQRVSRNFDNIRADSERITLQLEGATAALKEAGRNIDRMRRIRNPSGKTFLMETLPDLMPEGAELAKMTISESNQIVIDGFARNSKAIFFFQNELAASGLIEGITVNTSEDEDLIAFNLSGTLSNVE